MNKTISIANDFSTTPGARYRTDGKFSGQEFYEDILKPELDTIWNNPNHFITVDFDGTFGYASSFISEVFLRLSNDFKDKSKIKEKINFKSDEDPLLVDSVLETIDEKCES